MAEEEEEWQFIVKDIGPAQLEHKASSSTLSEKSDTNLQFMEVRLTESTFQKNERTQLPATAATMRSKKISDTASREDEIITTKSLTNTSATPSQTKPRNKETKNQPAPSRTVVIALISTSLIILVLAGSVVASSLIYSSYKQYSTTSSNSLIESPSSVLLRPSTTSSHPPSCSLLLPGSGDARLPEASPGGDIDTNNKEINARIDRLEQRVNQHDAQFTSLESQMNELTEMMLKFSSCGAHFYKTKPEFDFSTAVHGQDISDSLCVEGRTKILTHGSNSKDLIHAPPQCRHDVLNKKCARKNEFVLVGDDDKDGAGGGRKSDDDSANMRDLNELRDRIAALEQGMKALHVLLTNFK